MHESRRLSRETGTFIRVTPGSQSLERGVRLLRAFLEGAANLSNSQLAARTGLPKATVSRLTRSLVDAGLLEFDPDEEAYRLAPACLGFARAFQFSRSEVTAVNGVLKRFARDQEVNIGLSGPDLIHMVYISIFREMRGPHTRNIAPGGRLLMPTSSPGIAYLAAIDAARRADLYTQFTAYYGREWPRERAALNQSLHDTAARGYSYAKSAFGTVGVATTVAGPRGALYAINASYSDSVGLPPGLTDEKLARKVAALGEEVAAIWALSR